MKNKKPIVVAMIGLVGSGKSSVSKFLASKLKARLIASDEIRLKLL